ncbi:unnamed protein product [Rotaria sp. Silwood2]|nr:unnamed protein product [Rotaria sp. Silwood2]CAF4350080.1 unnamed protein product [Rotaria sp. Silwood2]
MSSPTSTKQRQITSFFQSKKQKTSEVVRNHVDSSNNLSVHVSHDEENFNPTQEFMSPEVTEVSTSTTTTAENETILKCNLLCCTCDGRYVPENFSLLKSTNDKRSCQLGWFNKHDWLSYCQSNGKVYCYYCRKAYQSGYHPQVNKMSDYSFTVRGFNCWKNALAKFERHENSQCHTDCIYLVKQQCKPSVAAQISLVHQNQQAQRRKMLLVQLKSIKFLLRQGLALRGHTEEEGNLIQVLKLKQDDISELSSWINEGTYLSHDIINEICELISLTIIRELLKEIRHRRFYSIICDEATDEAGLEQLCFTIRSVDDQFMVHEDVIGLYQLTSQNAEHITEVILDILVRCGLDIKLCRGQGYDGAATMAGHVSGVSSRIKNLNSKAYYVHCNAHSLDLALQDVTRDSPFVASALDITNDIVNFITKSPKRLNLLDKLTGLNSYSNLKPLCPTRWTVRASSMDSLVINYDLVKLSLDEISVEGGPPSIKANGFLEQMQKFSTYFGLKLDYFNTFYELILKEAESLTEEPVLTRLRKPPRRYIGTIRAPTVYQSSYDMYQQQYFYVINSVLNALDLRFQQSVFPLLCKVEEFIIAAANGTQDDDNINIESIVEFLNDDIDITRLKCELNLLPDYFSTINLEKNFGLKKISKIQTVCDLLNAQSIGKSMFHEYCKLLRLYLTVPITTATAERCFSVMNRIKTYLRSTMTQQRFNHVLIPHVHKEKLDQLDLNSICTDFIAKNQSRKAFFGHE